MISGNQVRWRAIERADLPRFVAWLNGPEATRGLSIDLPLSSEDEADRFEGLGQARAEERPLAIEVLHDQKVRQTMHEDGGYINVLLMSMLRSEWKRG